MTAHDLIDVHAHVFPHNVLAKIWSYFDKHHWPIHYREEDEDARTAQLEAHVQAYTTLCYAHRPGMAAWLNDYALAFAARHPRAIPTGTFHPDDPDVLDYVRDGIARGLRGFKLHLEVQRFDPGDPRLQPVYDLLTEAGSVLLVHTAGMPLPGPFTGPAHFAALVARAPALPIIVAHLGGLDFLDYLRFCERHPIYFDTAMVDVTYPGFPPVPEAWKVEIRQAPERFLFGSDFPNVPYPFEHQLDAVKGWGLSEDGLAQVLAGNARRLYRLG